jgi:AhpD family alkylhydroperoxidase
VIGIHALVSPEKNRQHNGPQTAPAGTDALFKTPRPAVSWLAHFIHPKKKRQAMAIRYPAPDLNALPDDIKAKVLEVQEKAGFVPNVFLALARRPAEWRAFFAYHDALMLKEESGNPDGSLTKGEREMIVTATSAANKCLYCVVAHGAILRIYEKNPLVADQVAINY